MWARAPLKIIEKASPRVHGKIKLPFFYGANQLFKWEPILWMRGEIIGDFTELFPAIFSTDHAEKSWFRAKAKHES